MKKTPSFSPHIFWDIQDIDYTKNPLTVLFKVIRYGNRDDFRLLKKIYGPDDIKHFLTKRGKELDRGEIKLCHLLLE